ncbi:DNA glycosylase [Pluteus cervinus]|uniref:DNA glycosylase n=1 Tax=Pluteus cervinus TaxID=181527 RepID=A0ACD3AZD5_9AGAR|nr:DNA glycosylase [Pluteus cervinus]
MRLVSDTEFEFEEDELPQLKKSNNKRKRGKTVPKKEEEEDIKAKKNSKEKRGFASPDKYAHLNELPDHVREELDILFCGINPGKRSAEIGHHFGGPTNHFWPCLFESGLTPARLRPQQDGTVVDFNLGLTNLVSRPTAQEGELGKAEFPKAVPTFLAKVAYFRPRIVAFVGMGIATVVRGQVLPAKKGSKKQPSPIGLEPYKLVYPVSSDADHVVTETLFYTLPSTSGRVTQYQKSDKTKLFAHLKATVEELKERKVDTSLYHIVDVASLNSGFGATGGHSVGKLGPTGSGIVVDTIADMDLNLDELMEIKEEILEGDS